MGAVILVRHSRIGRFQNPASAAYYFVNMRGGWVYILASKSGILYTGVTSRLDGRVIQHVFDKRIEGFTKKYKVSRLVYVEKFGDIRDAIAREKQIKGWIRKKKIALIEKSNPYWCDLAEEMFPSPPLER